MKERILVKFADQSVSYQLTGVHSASITINTNQEPSEGGEGHISNFHKSVNITFSYFLAFYLLFS
jgi:hypothetical protein